MAYLNCSPRSWPTQQTNSSRSTTVKVFFFFFFFRIDLFCSTLSFFMLYYLRVYTLYYLFYYFYIQFKLLKNKKTSFPFFLTGFLWFRSLLSKIIPSATASVVELFCLYVNYDYICVKLLCAFFVCYDNKVKCQ